MTTPTQVAGRYRLEGRLGAGGMSSVFLALDTVLERHVAVKLLAEHLAEDDAFVERFRQEALAAARLQHPNVVQVFDSGQDPESERHFIVMEYVEGPSCADLIRDHGAFEVEEAVRVVRDACHGLDYAHRARVVHRDVKPGNLLVSSETGAVKLADFGIAKAAERTPITQVGSVLGTAAYLSPEQARGDEVSPATDIYSLGVCAYQFLAGTLPHEYNSLTELALKQQNDRVEPITMHRPEVPVELDVAILLCLEADPAARYGSALELAEALEAGLHGESTVATQVLAAGATQVEADDRTRALPVDTAATRALPSDRSRRPPPTTVPPRRAARREEVRDRRREDESRKGPWPLILLVLALLVGAGVAIAVSQDDAGSQIEPVEREDVSDQVQGMKDLIRQHSR